MLTYHQMNDEEKEIVSNWQYPGIYEIYNLPPYSEQKQKQSGLGNPRLSKNYISYYDGTKLIAYTNIMKKDIGAMIGIGVVPELCGKGYGVQVLEIVVRLCLEDYPSEKIYLIVRKWNERAIKCYPKSGFEIERGLFEVETPSGWDSFLMMTYKQ